MARKRWQAKLEITPSLVKSRDKRKWQIALRRYVLEKNPSSFYAPYFGLDIETLRKWFEYQFTNGISWNDFGQKWQFDHILPVTYFDFADEHELKMCWNFLNLKIHNLQQTSSKNSNITWVKSYFKELYHKTGYKICSDLLDKIFQIENRNDLDFAQQQKFILEHFDYLKTIEGYSSFEFELLNSGRPLGEIQKEIDFLKRQSNQPK
ncbi:MAG TPA: hypothetical protein VGI82_05230 [Chitinophagaceae bacterium]|jgi:hypothetical protein